MSPDGSKTSQSSMARTAVAPTAGTWWTSTFLRMKNLTQRLPSSISVPGLSTLFLCEQSPCRWRTNTLPGQRATSFTSAHVHHVSPWPQVSRLVLTAATSHDFLSLLQRRLCPKMPALMQTRPPSWWWSGRLRFFPMAIWRTTWCAGSSSLRTGSSTNTTIVPKVTYFWICDSAFSFIFCLLLRFEHLF